MESINNGFFIEHGGLKIPIPGEKILQRIEDVLDYKNPYDQATEDRIGSYVSMSQGDGSIHDYKLIQITKKEWGKPDSWTKFLAKFNLVPQSERKILVSYSQNEIVDKSRVLHSYEIQFIEYKWKESKKTFILDAFEFVRGDDNKVTITPHVSISELPKIVETITEGILDMHKNKKIKK